MFSLPRPSHLMRGQKSEQLACTYLISQGLQLVEKNFSSKQGELDLIMRDQKVWVIVEVRFRKSSQYGGALESITPKKQSRIIATTQIYLQKNNITDPIRFDVIAMSSDNDISWIKNAFQT